MRFHLTSEQVAIQDAVRGTLAECWGMAQLHRFADGEADFDIASWQALMALGYNEKDAATALKALPADVGVSDGIKLALKSLSR